MVPAFSTGTQGINPRDSGAAAATVNAAQQIGASIGTALLNIIAASATAGYAASHAGLMGRAQSLVHGYSVATEWAAAILALGAVLAVIMINAGKPSPRGVSSDAPPVGVTAGRALH